MELKLSLYSEVKPDLTSLLAEARRIPDLTSLNKELTDVMTMFETQSMFVLHDGTTAWGCCGLREHSEYNYATLDHMEPQTLSNVVELCALYLRPEVRGQGWLRTMTRHRMEYASPHHLIIEIRPDNSAFSIPTTHPDAIGVELIAIENGFKLIGLNPKDNSPVYYRHGDHHD